jgi:hypothetical protein
MTTQSVLTGLEEPGRVAPDAQSLIPEVPRIIFLALDAFGSRVLRSLDEQLKEIPAFKRRLTVFLDYRAERGFQILTTDVNDKSKTRRSGRQKNKKAAESDTLDITELAQRLYHARQEAVCSQAIQMELLRQGLRISPWLEVYVISEVKTLAHLQLLRTVIRAVESYLRRFEPVLMTGIISLVEYEYPVSETNDRDAVLDGLNKLLSRETTRASESQQRGLERCYVITHEAMGGRSVIPDGELADRTAGFLAAHYLDSLRRPRTAYQHLLFGRQESSEPGMIDDCGLCDVFGYADLKFELNHVLDWCALEKARHVLSEAFLRIDEPAAEEAEEAQTWLDRELAAAGLTLSLEVLTERLLESVSRETTFRSEVVHTGSPFQPLVEWREQRREVDASLRRTEEAIKDEAKETQLHLEEMLSGALDRQISSSPQGLTQAEKLLDAIEARCTDELELARCTTDTPIGEDATHFGRINRSWLQLSSAATAIPTQSVFWGRAGLMALLAVLGRILGGVEGIGLTLISAVALFAWIIYVWLWLPNRLHRAQTHYQNNLATWRRAHSRTFVQQRLEQMMTDLLARFARPNGRDMSQTGEEWKALQEWRRKLTEAVRLSEEWALPWRALPSAQEGAQPGAEIVATQGQYLVISWDDLRGYYERLTVWQPSEVALVFLEQMRAAKAGWWRTCSAQKLASELRQVCRQLYQDQASQRMTSLEHHLLEISDSGETQLGILLDTLIQTALPMARFHRLHGRWELPTQRLLIVHDAEHSAFRELALQRSVQIINGARPHQMIYIQTVHHIPVYDLAIASDWQGPAGIGEQER